MYSSLRTICSIRSRSRKGEEASARLCKSEGGRETCHGAWSGVCRPRTRASTWNVMSGPLMRASFLFDDMVWAESTMNSEHTYPFLRTKCINAYILPKVLQCGNGTPTQVWDARF